jgi:hypothetical protein
MLNVVQDALVGSYLMSLEDFFSTTISRGRFFDALLTVDKVEEWHRKRLNAMNGKTLLSSLFPETFSYFKDGVLIENGVLREGTLNGTILNGKTSIIQSMFVKYGENVCIDFINNIQFLTNFWLNENGFTIHLGDCVLNTDFRHDIEKEWENDWKSQNGNKKLSQKLQDFCDRLMKKALESLAPTNNFLITEKTMRNTICVFVIVEKILLFLVET